MNKYEFIVFFINTNHLRIWLLPMENADWFVRSAACRLQGKTYDLNTKGWTVSFHGILQNEDFPYMKFFFIWSLEVKQYLYICHNENLWLPFNPEPVVSISLGVCGSSGRYKNERHYMACSLNIVDLNKYV